MFTGIVEEVGRLSQRKGGRLVFEAPLVARNAAPGDSIAVNGCCLTVVDAGPGWWAAEAVAETMERTNLAGMAPGDSVNLERPVQVGGRLGGHLVQGHVDGIGRVEQPAPELRVEAPAHLLRYVVEKGSVTVDGCSLTVVEAGAGTFTVAIIPHTAEVTTLGARGVGSVVNLEVDILAKYTERLLVANGVIPYVPGSVAMRFARVEDAIAAVAGGEMVVVVDDGDRENEGDLVMAAEFVTPDSVAFFLAHTSGLICVSMTGERLDQLDLPLMVASNTESQRTAFTVSVDYRHGTTTGISASDRAATVKALIDPQTRPADLSRPGHIFPLRYRTGGVLKRAGHTEAAVDLARAAHLYPAGVLCEVVNADKTGMARPAELLPWAEAHGLLVISIADLVRYRRQKDKLVRRVGEARVPTEFGEFSCVAYESVLDGEQHLALVRGNVSGAENVLVRVHSECLTGDVFGSLRCDCGLQLEAALRKIVEADLGAVVYLRGHEGRGIGLAHKLRAYSLQEKGRDTVDANIELGFPVDSREYGIGAQILVDLGVSTMRLMTNNPAKYGGLEGYGLDIVERVPLESEPNPENIEYLRAKRERMGHLLEGLDGVV